MFMYNVWLLAIKESENTSLKFLHVSLLAQYMSTNVVHKSYYIVLSSNTVLQNGRRSCTCMLIILTFWHTDIVQAIPNQL